jgi:hypothetical protein
MVFQRKSKKKMIRKKMSRKKMYKGGDDNDYWARTRVNTMIVSIVEDVGNDAKLNMEPSDYVVLLKKKIKEHADYLTKANCEDVFTSTNWLRRKVYHDFYPIFDNSNCKEYPHNCNPPNSVSGQSIPGYYEELLKHVTKLKEIAENNDTDPFDDGLTQMVKESLTREIMELVAERLDEVEIEDKQTWVKIVREAFMEFAKKYDEQPSSKIMDYFIFACANLELMTKHFNEVLALDEQKFSNHINLIVEATEYDRKKYSNN